MQLDLFAHGAGMPAPLFNVKLGGRTVPYTLKRSARARHVWLRIGIGTGLVVVAPAKMPFREVEAALEKKTSWITRHMTRMGPSASPAKRPPLKDGARLPYLGKEHTLNVHPTDGPPKVRLADGVINVFAPDGDEAALRGVIEAWYRKMARKAILDRVEKLRGGKKVGRVSVKSQKTRWGSCSTRGNLNFNWRLVMAPPKVMDYLIIHELTHIEHPDHSKRFWAKVAMRCPRYKEHEAWLFKVGRELSPI